MTRSTYHEGGTVLGVEEIPSHKNLQGRDLRGVDLRGVDLSDAYLEEANLRGANLEGVNLSNASLRRARLEGANLRGADLSGACLELAIAGAARFDEACLENADLSRANLVGASARGASCKGAVFYYARPGLADFSGVDMSEADLTRAIFRRADLRGVNLGKAKGRPNTDRALLDGAPEIGGKWRPLPDPAAPLSGRPAIFHAFLLEEPNESNVYIVACPQTRSAALIDAGGFDPAVVEFTKDQNLKLESIIITHTHYDHVDGLAEYLKAFDHPSIYANGSVPVGEPKPVRHGETLRLGELTGRFAETPGHTSDSISFIIGPFAFTGDCLFAGSIGGTHSEEANRLEREGIEKHLFILPLDTELYSGHGPGSTVYIEKNFNPFFA